MITDSFIKEMRNILNVEKIISPWQIITETRSGVLPNSPEWSDILVYQQYIRLPVSQILAGH